MATVTIKVGGQPVQVQDVNNDNTINGADNLSALATELGVGEEFLFSLLNGVQISNNMELDELIAKAVVKAPENDAEVEELLKKAESIKSKISALDSKISELDKKPNKSAADNKNLATAKLLKTALDGELSDATTKLQNAIGTGGVAVNNADLKKKVEQFLSKDSGKPGGDSSSGSVDYNGMAKALGANGAGGGNNAGKAGGSAPGAGAGKAGGPFGLGPVDPNSLMALSGLDGSTLQAWDIIGQAKKQQQLMLLFFYYAKMAMSGDIGAMYQFMRFVTHIIAQDKALQNVWMGTKLIELQDVSRKASQKLLDAQVKNDDTESQYNFQKIMQEVKAEENTVATSQKLIAQMMEEFTQIVETLTNVQKSLLDVNGKVLSNLSTWR